MEEKILTLFDKAKNSILNEEYISFYKIIKEVYDNYVTCNCSLKCIPNDYWYDVSENCNIMKSNVDDFYMNFAKGYILWKNRELELSLKYFTQAAKNNSKDGLSHYFLSIIEQDNAACIEHALCAISIQPIARNYFKLAQIYVDQDKSIEAICNYRNAIEKDESFICAYNNLANLYEKREEYKTAIEFYKKCIEIDPTYWCYASLWQSLLYNKNYQDALKFAKQALVYHPTEIKYNILIGASHLALGDHENALVYFEKWSECNNLIHESIRDNKNFYECILNSCKNILTQESIISDALLLYSKNDLTESLKKFNDYLELGGKLDNSQRIIYFEILLKVNVPNVKLGRENSIYKSIMESIKKGNKISNLNIYIDKRKLSFGKFWGKDIKTIINSNPDYIIWCIINLEHFVLSLSILYNNNLRIQPRYLEAVEINLAKYLVYDDIEKENRENLADYDYWHSTTECYNDWLTGEFGDDAEGAIWNID